MKIYYIILLITSLFVGTCGVSFAAAINEGDESANMQEVHDFLKGCGHYYLSTVEGDQPRVRPFGSLAIFEGKLYFQTGKVKDVSKQMSVNPKIEICAYDGKGNWLRVQAVAVEDERRETKQFMLDAHPQLKSMYSADDGNTQVLYLKEAIARFHSFSGETRVTKF
ncbi:MAG: pyridoxamine 5'-phosphate oxidase family protein [Synergistaceae bacterium]|nr:pyridoxamine 5'-phosphate oxidase family protein [Synergistaceae bacterium]